MIGRTVHRANIAAIRRAANKSVKASLFGSSCLNQASTRAPEGANSAKASKQKEDFPKADSEISPAERDRIKMGSAVAARRAQ